MHRLEGVATHMKPSCKSYCESFCKSDGVRVLFSGVNSLETMKSLNTRRIFDEKVCEFLSELSSRIFKDTRTKAFSDIISFGFFCRKANIERLKQQYDSNKVARLGRGLSFHIAPSNVPINLAYTLAAGLLAGNSCVIRASSKDFEQTKILCSILDSMKDLEVSKYIAIVGYEHQKSITDELSLAADVRVIWGGDESILKIRESPITARCVELCFADRYSLCVIESKSILELDDVGLQKLALDFYNDTYLYDQNACSSPRLIYWLGDKKSVSKAQEIFWGSVREFLIKRYEVAPLVAVDKLFTNCKAAVEIKGVKILAHDNLIHRISLENLVCGIENYACAGGSFLEYGSENLDELFKIVNKKYQTITHFGIDTKSLRDEILNSGTRGIDRIVPIGKASDFSLTWDGFDLISQMSRIVNVG